jgi:hypothetical protein
MASMCNGGPPWWRAWQGAQRLNEPRAWERAEDAQEGDPPLPPPLHHSHALEQVREAGHADIGAGAEGLVRPDDAFELNGSGRLVRNAR